MTTYNNMTPTKQQDPHRSRPPPESPLRTQILLLPRSPHPHPLCPSPRPPSPQYRPPRTDLEGSQPRDGKEGGETKEDFVLVIKDGGGSHVADEDGQALHEGRRHTHSVAGKDMERALQTAGATGRLCFLRMGTQQWIRDKQAGKQAGIQEGCATERCGRRHTTPIYSASCGSYHEEANETRFDLTHNLPASKYASTQANHPAAH